VSTASNAWYIYVDRSMQSSLGGDYALVMCVDWLQ
jgi:hypothetical protein